MSEGCCFETNNGTSMYLPSQNKEHCIVLYCNLLKILIILRRGACSSCSASSQMKTQILVAVSNSPSRGFSFFELASLSRNKARTRVRGYIDVRLRSFLLFD